ncbi:hypothetical protein CLV79_11541 [Limimaricola soesokkakensis]|uniref:Uncharacterized protein n=1 Tax=Limimaricola soesokkakensis TaxID=1343159 RepID=A0A1X7A188_9RHOB|nr:hypothetical protein CLV79_11541 [Limimaricola soesokkakensis]SLN67360.1 hypothetical protein LOS8367_03364 [Limimaricola soesokkakensis]
MIGVVPPGSIIHPTASGLGLKIPCVPCSRQQRSGAALDEDVDNRPRRSLERHEILSLLVSCLYLPRPVEGRLALIHPCPALSSGSHRTWIFGGCKSRLKLRAGAVRLGVPGFPRSRRQMARPPPRLAISLLRLAAQQEPSFKRDQGNMGTERSRRQPRGDGGHGHGRVVARTGDRPARGAPHGAMGRCLEMPVKLRVSRMPRSRAIRTASAVVLAPSTLFAPFNRFFNAVREMLSAPQMAS